MHFTPGLNVLTGESGAGKSVLVEAFAQVSPAASVCNSQRPVTVVSFDSAEQPALESN